jgi:hypothetical protein
MAVFNVKDWGAVGNGVDDDTAAIIAALANVASNANQYQAALRFASGRYLISDGTYQNQQAIQITGSGTSFTITVIAGTGPPTPTIHTQTTAAITYVPGNPTANASAMQTQLAALSSIPGIGGVTVTYNSTLNWYVVTFPASLGAPVMSASGANLSITITVLQSGAAIVIPNIYGLRLIGDGSALADYDQPGGGGSLYAPSSRSALVWNGTANGILIHLMGCNNVTIENLSFWGLSTKTATNQARTGLLFSPNLLNASGLQGGSALTCRSCVLTRFGSTATPAVSGGVQLGMNENDGAGQSDSGAETTAYHACTFAYGTNGLLVVSSQSVNHWIVSSVFQVLNIGAWFQQGGNVHCDGCKAESLTITGTGGITGGTILKIGPGSESPPYYYYGGGTNSSVFLLRNVRTNPLTGPNITVVDAAFAGPATQVVVDGWDDTAANPSDNTPAIIIGAGVSMALRHSLVNRPVLAIEGAGNLPSPTTPAALRIEDLVVPEYALAATLCQPLSISTKVDLLAERTSLYNIIRPDVSTMIGRPRYSPVNWLIEQQKPKYFYDLGDYGLVAPN